MTIQMDCECRCHFRGVCGTPAWALLGKAATHLIYSPRRAGMRGAPGDLLLPFARLFVVLLALVFGTAAAAPDDSWYEEPSRSALDTPPDIRQLTDDEGRRVHEGALAAGVLGATVRDADAVRLWREIIAISEATYGPKHPNTAHWYFRLGVRYAGMGQTAEATEYLQRALTIQRARLNPRHKNIEWTLSALADVLGPVEAEPILLELTAFAGERTMRVRRRFARLLNEIATDLDPQTGRAAEAAALRARARALADPKLDDAALDAAIGPVEKTVVGASDSDPAQQPPFVRAPTPAERLKIQALHASATLLDATGQAADATAVWRELTELDNATWGHGHPVTATHWLKFAKNLQAQNNVPGATTAFMFAHEGALRGLGSWHGTTIRAAQGLAEMLRLQGTWAQAEAMHRTLLPIFQNQVHMALFDDARALTNFANNISRSFRHAEAERYFRRAAALHKLYWRKDFGPAVIDLAYNLEAQGRLAEAEAMFAKAIALYPASPAPNDAEAAALRSRLALIKFAQGKSDGVEATLNETLKIYESWYGPAQYKTSAALADLGWFSLKTKQFAKAVPLLTRAATIRETLLGPNQPRTLQALQHVATAHLALNKPEQALAVARRVLAGRLAAGRTAAQGTDAALRNDIGARTGTAARTLVRAAWTVAARTPVQEAPLRAEAFAQAQAIEQSQAADALSRGAARLLAGRAGAGPHVRAWSNALSRIDWLNAKMTAAAAQGPKGDAERARLAADLRVAIAARDAAEKTLAASYPPYFDLLRPQPVPVAALQATTGENAKLLRNDEALILLYPGDAEMTEGQRNGIVFVVTKTATAWAEIAMAPDELKRHIVTIHKQLAEGGATLKPGDDPESVVGFERQRAYLVYRALFGHPKIEAALRDRTRWLLAPQGSLVGLPFTVLVMEPPPGGEERDADPAALRKTAWLGLKRTLALVPSVGVLKLQRLKVAAAPPATPRFFGLGDPAFRGVPDPPASETDDNATRAFVRRSTPRPGRDYFRSGAGDPKRIAELKRLPQTAREIRALAATLKATDNDFVLQVNATEAELRRRNQNRSLQQAEVIAFATHGLIAGDLQETLTEPALVLTPPVLKANQKPVAANDGLLTASEAAGLTLNADWVILSACNTASGTGGNAESLTGLARAFLFAGARSLLVSHYPILDKSAMMLTTAAVASARDKRLRRPEALQAAMAKVLADTSRDTAGVSFAHPSAWAPFAIIDAN